jgi:hypothetical protein
VRHLDEGRVVDAGTPVLTLQDERDPQARIGVPARVADGVHPSARLALTIAGRRYDARVRAVLPVTGARTRTVDLLLDLEAPPGVLRAGALAELALSESVPARGAWVPLQALTAGRRGTWVLYGLERDAAASGAPAPLERWRVVTFTVELIAQDGVRAFVRGPLDDGERVIAHGVDRVVPGQRVQPAPDATEGGP